MIAHYTKIQLYIGVGVALLSGLAQFTDLGLSGQLLIYMGAFFVGYQLAGVALEKHPGFGERADDL